MARSDIARDLDDRSLLAQNMVYTGNVSRTLKPYLERHSQDQSDTPVDTWETEANEKEILSRFEELVQGEKRVMSESGSGVRRTIIQEPIRKGSGEKIIRVSIGPSLLKDYSQPISYLIDT